MPNCSVCRAYTDYEYDMELSDGRFLHESCLLKLQIRKDELESILRTQGARLILSLFVPFKPEEAEVLSETKRESLTTELDKVTSELTSIYDHFKGYPPDWEQRKQQLIQQDGAICSECSNEGKLYLVHKYSLFEDGTNELDNLQLICSACHVKAHGEANTSGTFKLKPSQVEFAEQVTEIQGAIDSDRKIRFDYKKPSVKNYKTRVVIPERLFNIPNSRESGETLCVEGFCELRQATRVFALERMRDLTVITD